MTAADPAQTARFLGAFFDELACWGVHDVVISPGSRSTPLAMTAYELHRRAPWRMRVFVDVDERGAAFFALGMAKASGCPAALICTSGTAVANYYPAITEAEASRIPLVVLTGDRPPRLQGLGAPQTCNQLNMYGNHVRSFRQMPLPNADDAALAFARQAAREAVIASCGGGRISDDEGIRIAGECQGAPVHVNFPFDEPLKPDFTAPSLFETGRRAFDVVGLSQVCRSLDRREITRIHAAFQDWRVMVYAGEGSCSTDFEARRILAWAGDFNFPILADPLSGLRCFSNPLVIDNYDCILGEGGTACEKLTPQLIIRFGRYPVSKAATQFATVSRAAQIVVDAHQTRDFNDATDLFVRTSPAEFAAVLNDTHSKTAKDPSCCVEQQAFLDAWIAANNKARLCVEAVDNVTEGFEGVFVRRLVELAPAHSCLFTANSMSVRALDTFYLKSDKTLSVLCNRGLNGIDGTLSTALGAAQYFQQTTLLIGDLALLHDINAFALQRELQMQKLCDGNAASIVVVLLNNNGGGIFDMLPQKSQDDYFERLFLTPQDVDFEAAAHAFKVPYCRAETVEAFEEAYRGFLGTDGISLVEVPVPLMGLKERYIPYWSVG